MNCIVLNKCVFISEFCVGVLVDILSIYFNSLKFCSELYLNEWIG